MNAIYQLVSSASIMAIAIAFLVIARRVRPFEPSIVVSSDSPLNPSKFTPIKLAHETSEELAEQFMITNGINPGSNAAPRRTALANGIVYWSNLDELPTTLRQERIYLLGNSARIAARQLLSPIPSSGIIFMHLDSDRISLI